MQTEQKLCPQCHSPITDSYYFCPNCGKNLKPAPLSTTILSQIGVYALSIFLPPFGLWPAVKYLRQSDEKAKIVGWIAIVLTIVSIIVTTWLATAWFNQINQQVTQQLNRYQNIGY